MAMPSFLYCCIAIQANIHPFPEYLEIQVQPLNRNKKFGQSNFNAPLQVGGWRGGREKSGRET